MVKNDQFSRLLALLVMVIICWLIIMFKYQQCLITGVGDDSYGTRI